MTDSILSYSRKMFKIYGIAETKVKYDDVAT